MDAQGAPPPRAGTPSLAAAGDSRHQGAAGSVKAPRGPGRSEVPGGWALPGGCGEGAGSHARRLEEARGEGRRQPSAAQPAGVQGSEVGTGDPEASCPLPPVLLFSLQAGRGGAPGGEGAGLRAGPPGRPCASRGGAARDLTGSRCCAGPGSTRNVSAPAPAGGGRCAPHLGRHLPGGAVPSGLPAPPRRRVRLPHRKVCLRAAVTRHRGGAWASCPSSLTPSRQRKGSFAKSGPRPRPQPCTERGEPGQSQLLGPSPLPVQECCWDWGVGVVRKMGEAHGPGPSLLYCHWIF